MSWSFWFLAEVIHRHFQKSTDFALVQSRMARPSSAQGVIACSIIIIISNGAYTPNDNALRERGFGHAQSGDNKLDI